MNQIVASSDVNENCGFRHRLSDRELAEARKRCKSVPRTTYSRQVYFAAADDGPIKIGASCNIKRRLRELRTKAKQDLKLLAITDGGMFAECMYHQQFAAHRLHGEWFVRHPDILAEIDRLNQTGRKAASTAPGPDHDSIGGEHG